MTEAQKMIYNLAENMRMDKSISEQGYEYFQQAIKALERQDKAKQIIDDCDLEAWEVLEKIKEVMRA